MDSAEVLAAADSGAVPIAAVPSVAVLTAVLTAVLAVVDSAEAHTVVVLTVVDLVEAHMVVDTAAVDTAAEAVAE